MFDAKKFVPEGAFVIPPECILTSKNLLSGEILAVTIDPSSPTIITIWPDTDDPTMFHHTLTPEGVQETQYSLDLDAGLATEERSVLVDGFKCPDFVDGKRELYRQLYNQVPEAEQRAALHRAYTSY